MPTHDADAVSDQPDPGSPLSARDDGSRRRRAEVFGDVLPDQARDDRDPEGPASDARDDELRRDVPPHHG
jgi:hypothetical protein